MTVLRRVLGVCLVLTCSYAIAPAQVDQWDWTVTPSSPSSPGSMRIDVQTAPSTPVVVSIYVNGQFMFEETISSLPGTARYSVPSGHSGESWEVRLTAGTSSDSKGGYLQ